MKKYRIVSHRSFQLKKALQPWQIELRRSLWREHKQYLKYIKRIISLGDNLQYVPSDNDTATQAITNSLIKLLPEAMSVLTQIERNVIVCYFYEDMNDTEIAEATGKSKQTVNKCRKRALLKMQKFYELKK